MSTRIANKTDTMNNPQSFLVQNASRLTLGLCLPAAFLLLLVPPISLPLLGQSTSPPVILAASTFEAGADGWFGTNNLNGQEALAVAQGYISVSETTGDGALMFLVAPQKFLGDQRRAYNGSLSFRLRQSATSELTAANRFVVLGSGNAVLSFDLALVPGTNWQTFEIPLNEHVGWHKMLDLGTSDQRAAREDFLTVLHSLDRLWIRGEYSGHNADRTDLADVKLRGQTSGPLRPTLAVGTYAGITIDGAVGSSYRIEYKAALDPGENWQKLDDVVLPFTPYLFVDQTSPRGAQRFYRAVSNE